MRVPVCPHPQARVVVLLVVLGHILVVVVLLLHLLVVVLLAVHSHLRMKNFHGLMITIAILLFFEDFAYAKVAICKC